VFLPGGGDQTEIQIEPAFQPQGAKMPKELR
jgi:hypothetical protein